MAGDFDHSDFVDPDFEGARRTAMSPSAALATQSGHPGGTSAGMGSSGFAGSGGARPPSRDDINRQVTAAQEALVRLKQQQEDLERERTQLEESRRRRHEYEQGREEMLAHLTRGIGILTEAEQAARRDAEQMARTLADMQSALDKVSALNEQAWTADTYQTELTRALTTLENARMEWNSAQTKWTRLTAAAVSSPDMVGQGGPSAGGFDPGALLNGRSPAQLARLGLALTWPVALAVLLAGLGMALVLGRR
jgi:hypothetical protein